MYKKQIKYRHYFDDVKSVTNIYIIYKDICVLSLEIYGQLQPAAVKEYAIEAVELLIAKGVIKNEIN